ncbi:MAG: hypothetical protein WCP18_03520 [bacterium]
MSEKHKCHLCSRVGQNGAQWILKTGKTEYRVHKPCGQQLADSAPHGVETKLIPSGELKREWTEKKRQNDARQFWTEKFPGLVQLKDTLPSVPKKQDAVSARQIEA